MQQTMRLFVAVRRQISIEFIVYPDMPSGNRATRFKSVLVAAAIIRAAAERSRTCHVGAIIIMARAAARAGGIGLD
jgi:hypothetical protein